MCKDVIGDLSPDVFLWVAISCSLLLSPLTCWHRFSVSYQTFLFFPTGRCSHNNKSADRVVPLSHNTKSTDRVVSLSHNTKSTDRVVSLSHNTKSTDRVVSLSHNTKSTDRVAVSYTHLTLPTRSTV